MAHVTDIIILLSVIHTLIGNEKSIIVFSFTTNKLKAIPTFLQPI